jgi:asparagine synthase (glutamine-hydrolysing)
MAQALDHRGPDDRGTWTDRSARVAFGFRRLSVQDLSTAGHQPMTSPSGRFSMVYNGEVYNFQKLRDQLGDSGSSFRGHSDSEVILHAFERWGVRSAVVRFIGMFAIAVWDRDAGVLWLIRDRLGVKPLYVARTSHGIAFASQLSAIMRAPGFTATAAPSEISDYLAYLFFPGPTTPFKHVRKVLPGHLLRLKPDTADQALEAGEPWWTVGQARRTGDQRKNRAPCGSSRSSGFGRTSVSSASDPRSDSEVVEALDHILGDAVRQRLVADVPVGALLSGGIDSSLVVALMQRYSTTPVRTFTIGFDDPVHDESGHARSVADYLGTKHTELVVTGADALQVVPRLPEIFDEPLADPSQIPTYLVSALAREHVTVALSGDGGDELFAGYTRHVTGSHLIPKLARWPATPRRWLGSVLATIPPHIWERMWPLVTPRGHELRLVAQKMEKLGWLLQCGSENEMYLRLLRAGHASGSKRVARLGSDAIMGEEWHVDGERTLLSNMLALDQRVYLPEDLLQKVDRASMAVSLELRVPMLDHRVVEFSWKLEDHHKLRQGEGKWVLRQLLRRYVPPHLVDRPKTGFSVPLARWLRGPLAGWAEELLFRENPSRDALISRREVRASLERLKKGRESEALALWAVLMFELWRDRWVDGPQQSRPPGSHDDPSNPI